MLNYLNVERGHDNEVEIFKKDYQVMEQMAKEAKKTMLEIKAQAVRISFE